METDGTALDQIANLRFSKIVYRQARVQIAMPGEGLVLGVKDAVMRGDALVPGETLDALAYELRRQFQAAGGPVGVLRLIEGLGFAPPGPRPRRGLHIRCG